MFLFKKIDSLHHYLTALRARHGGSIGFVPTMGALHDGHLALCRQAAMDCDHTLCSIFVNPTQFNDASDLEKYPRTPAKDIQMLASVGTDILFMPGVNEVYPTNLSESINFDFGDLDKVMEGTFRPGHFAGVAQVIKRLLDIIQPDRIFMGQKDYQQVLIVKALLRQLHSPVHLVMYPTVREADGLALSSRNVRLHPDDRKKAPVIYQTLKKAKALLKNGHKPLDVQQWAMQVLQEAGLQPEYFQIVDSETLQALARLNEANKAVICTAVWAADVRLIDNLILEENELGTSIE